MELLPLQLYRQAYTYHYKEKNEEKAVELYRKIINTFPESEVSTYAMLQLSKIQANAPAVPKHDSERSSSRASVAVLLVINFLFTLSTLLLLSFFVYQGNKKHFVTTKVSQCLGKIAMGKEKEALSLLDEIKLQVKNDITPFLLTADIYLKQNDFVNARKEFETFAALCSNNDQLATYYIDIINKKENFHKITITQNENAGKKREKSTPVNKQIPHQPEPEPTLISTKDIYYF